MNEYAPRKIIIAVAPVGRTTQPPAVNPLTPKQVAEEVIRCARAGASMVHLHVRDTKGVQTEDIATYSETLDRIRRSSDIVIQGSTGGLTTLTLEQRCVALNDPRTEVASLNMGSVNLGEDVYINRLPDIRYWAKRMRRTRTVPELEIFDSGMLPAARALVRRGRHQAALFHLLLPGLSLDARPGPQEPFLHDLLDERDRSLGDRPRRHDGFQAARHRCRAGGISCARGLRGQQFPVWRVSPSCAMWCM